MHRKSFIQLSSSAVAGMMLEPYNLLAGEGDIKNWAGNLTYSTRKLTSVQTIQEAQDFLRKHPKCKALGTRHCFNNIADSKDEFISLLSMNTVIDLDETNKTVTVGGGIKYGELAPYLHNKGYALHNLASLPHISVAGACTTATHGSGMHNGNLSTQVVAIEILNAAGEVVKLSKEKDGENFLAAVVSLGALGVVTKLTLSIQPTYMVTQHVYQQLPLQQLTQHFEAIENSGYSVSLFTDWQTEFINEVWIKSKVEEGKSIDMKADFYGAKAATKNLHPIVDLSAENCTEQMGVPGPWYERLPHFKMGFTPSSGKELQSEYFVPRQHAVEAILAIQKMGKKIGPHLFITEIRAIDGDDFWMSPCYHRPGIAIHFTWKQEIPEVMQLLPQIEKELASFDARPHWGKIFTIPAARLNSLYEKLPEFRKMATQFDPQGKFRNSFLDKNIFG
ncbi:MAG: FAD-binding protein [Agriterribacter sp.]